MVNDQRDKLIGSWITYPHANYLGVTLQYDFADNGRAVCTSYREDGNEWLSYLIFEVEGDVLMTDQPSHPREARCKFYITPDDKLILISEEGRSEYVRCEY